MSAPWGPCRTRRSREGATRGRSTTDGALMELGLLSLGDLLPDPATGISRTEAERHRSLVEQGVLAEQLGFHSVHLGEHHGSGYQLSAPAVVLAAIGERTSRLTLSTGVSLAANLDPFRMAEDYATVDVLSAGRAEIVVGRGSFFARTFEIFGQDPADSRALFDEHVRLLLRLLTEERVDHAGPLRPVYGETSRPRPLTPITVWVGGGSSHSSIDLAAALGCPLMLPSVFAPPETFVAAVARYREQWQRAGHASAPRVGACCHCHVARDSQTAHRQFKPAYSSYWNWVQDLVVAYTPQAQRMPFDYDAMVAGPAVVGSPAQVVDRIGHFRELLGLERMLFKFDLGGMPDATLYPTLELFGHEVMSALA